MTYVHYWHFQKAWYVRLTDCSTPERVYWHDSARIQEFWNQHYLIAGSEWMTEREVRTKLKEANPDFIIIKDKPFHEGRRWFGYKDGSRR